MEQLELFPRCLICGANATRSLGGSEVLHLCTLSSCEAALVNEINEELNAAAEAAKE